MRDIDIDTEPVNEEVEEEEHDLPEPVFPSDDDIVEPVFDIPKGKRRLYKPRIRKDKVEQPAASNIPTEIPERILREIEVLQGPIVELDQRPDPPPPQPEPEPPKTKKKEANVTCPNCSKEMLKKTFLYYHSLKCLPEREPEKELQQQPREEAEAKETKIMQLFSTDRHIKRREYYKTLTQNAF